VTRDEVLQQIQANLVCWAKADSADSGDLEDVFRRQAAEWSTILLALDSRPPVVDDVSRP